MTDNNNQKNKQETLNEEEKKKELSMEDLEQVTGGLALNFKLDVASAISIMEVLNTLGE